MKLVFGVNYPNIRTKKRPRSARVKGRIAVYDSQASEVKADRFFTLSCMKRQGLIHRLSEPLHLEMNVSFRRPKSRKKDHWHSSTPDLDNILKYYMDVLNGLVYVDDRYISSFRCSKKYALEDTVEIRLYLLEAQDVWGAESY